MRSPTPTSPARPSAVSTARDRPGSFLGNDIVYPAQGPDRRQLPAGHEGPRPDRGRDAREGLGLLGSPAFEIPRSRRPRQHVSPDGHRARRPAGLLAAQARHNLATMSMWLLGQVGLHPWPRSSSVWPSPTSTDRSARSRSPSASSPSSIFTLFYVCFVERASTGFRGVPPDALLRSTRSASGSSERFFKLQAGPGLHAAFIGTPFQSWFWRLVGVRLGRRLLRRRVRHGRRRTW